MLMPEKKILGFCINLYYILTYWTWTIFIILIY